MYYKLSKVHQSLSQIEMPREQAQSLASITGVRPLSVSRVVLSRY